MMWKYMLMLVGFFVLPTLAEAACSGASPTWTAASPLYTDIAACITAASTADTINIPAGTSAWGAAIVLINKTLTIIGAGIDQTNISCTSGSGCFYIGNTTPNSSRLSGFTLTIPAGTAQAGILVDGDGWRIDHVKIQSTTSGVLVSGIEAHGLRRTAPHGPTGLIDHVVMIDAQINVNGYPDVDTKSGALWVSNLGLGNASAVYIEDSQLTNSLEPNLHDCNDSGRYVSRFNTFSGSSTDAHSHQGFRGCRRWELYGNQYNFTGAYFTPIFLRGGTGVIFNNAIQSGWTDPGVSFDNVRSFSSAYGGMCNGTSAIDGNISVSPAADAGWPCRDQIGWNTDAFEWTVATPNPPQQHEPAYIWDTTVAGSPVSVTIRNGTAAWIQPNRDYYLGTGTIQTSPTSPFNGTTGTGFGTLANRPSTCTTYGDGSGAGVGYWATDQGSWNTSSSNAYGVQANGADGLLYRCTATNTWTLYYTPYTYPHPLQGAPTPPAPDPITGTFSMAAFSGNTFAIFIWPRSTDAAHKQYNVYRCPYSGVCTILVYTITPTLAAVRRTPETQFFDSSLYVSGTYYYSVSDVNTSDYVGPASTPVPISVTGKQ